MTTPENVAPASTTPAAPAPAPVLCGLCYRLHEDLAAVRACFASLNG